MNKVIEESAYLESYEGEFITKIAKGERYVLRSARINALKHLAYISIVAISFFLYFFLRDNATFSLFGASLIAGATIVTGLCLMMCFRAQNFFASNDPAFGSRHITKIKRAAQEEREGTAGTGNGALQYRESLTLLHSKNRVYTAVTIQECIMWEIVLVTIGTIVWGFWDVLYSVATTGR